MAAVENNADVGNEEGNQSPTSFPVSRRCAAEGDADSPVDGDHRTSSAATMTSSAPSLLSSKATAFSIDSLIRSRDFLAGDYDGDGDNVGRPDDGGNNRAGSCSSADLEYIDDDEDLDDGRCSLDGDGDVAGAEMRRRSNEKQLSPSQTRGKIKDILNVLIDEI